MHFLVCQFLQCAMSFWNIFIAYHFLQKMSDYLYFSFYHCKSSGWNWHFMGRSLKVSANFRAIFTCSATILGLFHVLNTLIHRDEPDTSRLRRERQHSPSSIFLAWIFIQLYKCSLASVLPSDTLWCACASPKIPPVCLHETMKALGRRSGSVQTHKAVTSKGQESQGAPLSFPSTYHISRLKFCGSSSSPGLCARGSWSSSG